MWFLLFTTLALADFNGHWRGTGTLTSNKHWQGECPVLDARIEQTRHRFRLLGFNYACMDIGFTNDYPYDFRITPDGRLRDSKGTQMGTISETTLHIEFLDKEGQTNWWHLEKNPDGSLEHSDSSYWGEDTFIHTKGTLRKVD